MKAYGFGLFGGAVIAFVYAIAFRRVRIRAQLDPLDEEAVRDLKSSLTILPPGRERGVARYKLRVQQEPRYGRRVERVYFWELSDCSFRRLCC
jgi:hypothetical protein